MTDTSALNFCYPVDIEKLRNDKIRLVPFNRDLNLFAQHYVQHTSTPTALNNFHWLPYGPSDTTADFLSWYNKVIQPNNAVVWFAVLVSSAAAQEAQRQRDQAGAPLEALHEDMKVTLDYGEEYFAGTIGFLNAKADDAVCEIGHINILPAFQRTFIATSANTLLLHYLLDPISDGCLALRRVVWVANASNARSVATAQRLGFTLEGIMRWHRILPEGKEGKGGEEDGRGPRRDTAMLSICWDDWRNGVREKLRALK